MRTTSLPPGGEERAAAWLEGNLEPAEPRAAATVLLLRDGPRGLETWLMRRRASMAFAAGMVVFPGGGVDPRDEADHVPWAGPPPAVWAQALGCGEPLARALVCAAVRETFEECGVLLAGPSPSAVVGDLSAPAWEHARCALEARELAFSDLLRREGLVLRTDLLRPFAHWLTPAFESRRFDTRFFLAALPAGQRPRDVQGEASEAGWWPVAEAVAAGADGRLPMMPPTVVSLEEVARSSTAAAALAAAPAVLRRVEPVAVRAPGGRLVLELDLP